MKIAMLASNRRPIPSPSDLIFAPGVIIYELTEGLVRKGQEVTLFAPEGTKTSARLVTAGTRSLYDDFAGEEDFAQKRIENLEKYWTMDVQYELLMTSTAFEFIKKNQFDIVHCHKTLHEIYFSKFINAPCLFTIHDAAEREAGNDIDILRLKKYAKETYFVSISNAQRIGLDYLNFIDTVYNGIDLKNFEFSTGGETILFAGRLNAGKGLDKAVEIARMSGKPLNIAGDIVPTIEGQKFYNKVKESFNNQIKFLGHTAYSQMTDLYRQSKILLFPIKWNEPFGLVMIEAMACGTPVVAFGRGSVPEIVKDGETGFICPPDDLDCMIKAVKKIYDMPEDRYQAMRQACRKHVEENFTVEKMVDGYERAYQKVIEDWKKKNAS